MLSPPEINFMDKTHTYHFIRVGKYFLITSEIGMH